MISIASKPIGPIITAKSTWAAILAILMIVSHADFKNEITPFHKLVKKTETAFHVTVQTPWNHFVMSAQCWIASTMPATTAATTAAIRRYGHVAAIVAAATANSEGTRVARKMPADTIASAPA